MKNKNNFLLAIAFISGLSIMAMEISASRLLAPYFGTSIFVWTNIIGVVLVALSLGYYFGGKLADKKPQIGLLLRLIFGAGVLFLIIPLVIKPLSATVNLEVLSSQSSSAAIFLSSLIIAAVLFALPLFLLGMVSPFIIKLYLLGESDKIGEFAGRVSAISTIGSILGTFLPTLYFIPVLGTRITINIFALILILLGSLGFKRKKLNFLVLLVLPGIVYASGNTKINNYSNILFEDESAYQYISVREDLSGTRYLSVNEASGFQSVYNQKKVLTGYYYDYYNVLPYLINSTAPKKVLIIGLCGGTIANQLNYFFKENVEVDGVEIDSKVIDVAKEYFNLDPKTTKIYNSDGRMFLQNNTKKYDLIIVDAYSQELYIPWTLTTREFWGLVNDSLKSEGVMAININAVSPETRLLKSISNTVASVFPEVYLTKTNDNGINYVLTAANKSLDFNSLPSLVKSNLLKPIASDYQDVTKKVIFTKDSEILTDDKAPVEFMTDRMVLEYLKK
jgi:spermidine synthase